MRSRQPVFIDQDRYYALTRDAEGRLFLEVVTGGIATETVVLPLNESEITAYRDQGKAALDVLAWKVAKQRSRFADRLLD